MEVVLAGPELDQFRRNMLSGEAVLARLAGNGGRLLISVAVGVGKSRSLDDTTETAVRSGRYDLVVVLCPTRRVLDERRFVKNKPTDIDVRVIKRRPATRCGALDERWKRFERNGLGLLGRKTLCDTCPARAGCPWVRQYGKALRDAQVIFATQAHLQRDPTFIDNLKEWTRAERVLVLIDENDFVLASCDRSVAGQHLQQFQAVLNRLPVRADDVGRLNQRWGAYLPLLLGARPDDLFGPNWVAPKAPTRWAMGVQEAGYSAYGDAFHYIANDLRAFGRSSGPTRSRLNDGGVRFSTRPQINTDVIIFSGTCVPDFVKFRVGLDLVDPFAEYRFRHPDTKWFNIASALGAGKYFVKNEPQILDFYATLIARRHHEGKRCLLVSKKAFVPRVAEGLQQRFNAKGVPLKIVIGDFTPEILGRPETVPLIHYGLIGTNAFEDFDCAFCLNSYNVNERVLDSVVQDLARPEHHVPLHIGYSADWPRRRQVKVQDPRHRYTDVGRVANLALQHKEMDVVLQAVGRVRPYTKPREIILFQCGTHPQVEYEREFNTLDEARLHFGVPGRREQRKTDLQAEILAARAAGFKQTETAELVGKSLSTVGRYWNEPVTNPL